MGSLRALADFQDVLCPACGMAINTGSAPRKRKVQCPKCREIVELPKPEPVAAVAEVLPDATAARIAELEARLLRLEALEARIAALESAKQPAEIVPFPEPVPSPPDLALPLELPQPQPVQPPPPPQPSRPARKIRWMAPSEGHRASHIPLEVQDVLHHNLINFTACGMTLRAGADNPVEWQRAEQLKAVFERANWQVSGPYHTVVRRGEHGLSLAVGTLPPPAEAAALQLALKASGFLFDSVLDQTLGNNEAVLIVG